MEFKTFNTFINESSKRMKTFAELKIGNYIYYYSGNLKAAKQLTFKKLEGKNLFFTFDGEEFYFSIKDVNAGVCANLNTKTMIKRRYIICTDKTEFIERLSKIGVNITDKDIIK